MTTREEILATLRQLPLRQDVRWLTLPELAPGIVFEAEKHPDPLSPAFRAFGAVDLDSPDCAAAVADLHNDALDDGLCAACKAIAADDDKAGAFAQARGSRAFCRNGHKPNVSTEARS